jgi:hypothetical protein
VLWCDVRRYGRGLFEDCPPFRALRRSETLAQADPLRIILILGLLVLFLGLAQWAVATGYHLATAHHVLNQPIRRAVLTLFSALVRPVIPAVVVVLYYDLRIRREGLDLELMARSMGPA